ncbi:sensor histidine kinase [Candidatus Magnetomonas plexicatena]|uniref:sensor histidine kinase n=1 Tax=Candidatus Magnetomonas plexicatena TaxID=2552947 RepID=UPI001100FD87|nr:response regulator [Nitrospirales bacterium LBB_01]
MTAMKMTVLIVDDDAASRQLLRQILKDIYNLSFATDGINALAKVQKVRPDLILLDILMPEMDGYETCQRLKAIPATADIPIIFISTLSDITEKVKAFKGGGVDYISKPFQSEEVLARVETHLKLYNFQRFLERRVEEEVNNRRVEEQMLIQQSKMAAMGEMINAISHQWKQPLNSLGLIVQCVEDEFEYGEVDKKYVKDFVKQTMELILFMSQTIDAFRNLLKPSRIKYTFDVTEAVYELVNLFSDMLKKDDICIRINTPQTCCISSIGYPNELKQVILNLINNSRDAINSRRKKGIITEDGLITIDIKEGENRKVVASISDNGGGIDPMVLDNLFKPYVTTKGDEGTGIGLYMSKAIIEGKMDGKISVSNIEGGAQFVIELPLANEGV